MRATVVDLAQFACRGTVVLQEGSDGTIQGGCQHQCRGAVTALADVLQAGAQGAELPQGVPSQVVLGQELGDVFGGRAARAGLEESAAGQQRDDGQHLGAGAHLEDREEVGEVVTQDVSGDRDGVLALANPFQGERHGVDRGQDAEVQSFGVVLGEVPAHLRDDLTVVGPGLVQPEHRRGVRQTSTFDGQPHPVAHRNVLDAAHPPDVAGLHLLADEHLVTRTHLDGAVAGNDERRRVGSVLLGLLGHESDIGHVSHGGLVEGTVGATVVQDGRVHRGVAAIRDDGQGLLELALGIPHASAVAHDGGHRGVDDDLVAGVQVRDARIGVHHRQRGACRELLGDGHLHLLGRVGGQLLQPLQKVCQAQVGVGSHLGEVVTVALEDVGEERLHGMAEEHRVGDLHHGGLEVQGPQHPLLLGLVQGVGVEVVEFGHRHVRGVDDLPVGGLQAGREHGTRPVVRDMDDVEALPAGDEGFLVVVEVAVLHVGDAPCRLWRPLGHGSRMGLGVDLDGSRCTSVRVALPQNRVDGRAKHGGVTSGDLALLVGLGGVGAGGDVVAVLLQLVDGRLELGHRGGDVGKFDDVGVW